MTHMASTYLGADMVTYGWTCRCGDGEAGYPTRADARRAGDAHLAVANAPPAAS